MPRPMFLPFACLLAFFYAGAIVRAEDPPKPPVEPTPIVVEITLKGEIAEEPSAIGLEGTPVSDNLKSLIDTIKKAKADKAVKGMVLQVRELSIGWGKVHELRTAIKDFRTSGKKVVAVLEMVGNAEYMVAAAADEIVMPEGGWLMLKGLSAELSYYKTALERLGVHVDVLHVGEFKSAGEPFSRTEMSPAHRAEMVELLGGTFELMVEAIAQRQGITPEAAKALIEEGPYTPKTAKALGLVNRIAYPDQVESEVAKGLSLAEIKIEKKYGKKKTDPNEFSGLAGFMKLMQQLSGDSVKKPSSTKPKIAVIVASGTIQTGNSSGSSIMGGATMGSDTVIKNLRQADKDKTVKAIVLRVDSPGGSALASDLMWREITRIEKPVIASMSDVAASGGYYISMGADKILAEPGTITGSIGVVSIKPALGGLMEKVGITTDTVVIGKNGDFLSGNRAMTEGEKLAMQKMMDETYEAFVSKAAAGRKMDAVVLEKLARGRVYTGKQAKALGLVDELGTLDDAIRTAKSLSGLDSEDTELLMLPESPNFLDSFLGPLGGKDRDTMANLALSRVGIPDAILVPLTRLSHLLKLFNAEPVVTIVPYDLRIR